MAKRKSKKPRGSRGVRQAPCLQDRVSREYLDLFVPLPKPSSAAEVQIQSKLLLTQVMNRLAYTGYSTAAVAHTVYGRPKPDVDDPDTAFPASLFSWEGDKDETKRPVKRRRTEADTKSKKPPIGILKRLHAVVENLSDVSAYTARMPSETGAPSNSTSDLLEQYDMVSVSPRNDATFQAACASATAADIVTLDYTAGRGGVQLPFRIRPSDVRAIVERGAALELPYVPALLRPNLRKALVQTARELQMASTSVRPKPRILFSSGVRTVGDTDVGAMALRSPGDLINVLQTVLRFDQTTSYDALSASATAVLTRSHEQRFGGRAGDVAVEVCIDGEKGKETKATSPQGSHPKNSAAPADEETKPITEEQAKPADVGIEDGFITLT